MTTHGLYQLINVPTRITQKSRTLIDLIFVSRSDMVREANVLEPFCSDYCPVMVNIKECIKPKKTIYNRKVYDYNLVNTEELCCHVDNADWENILSSSDINMNTDAFMKTIVCPIYVRLLLSHEIT